MNKLIDIQHLSVGYENKPTVLHNVNLTVYKKDFLGIIGPNGGGKTTLLKAILGLIKPSKGVITFFDNEKKVNTLNIGYLPQINQIDKRFPISVEDVILSGLTPAKRFIRKYSDADRRLVYSVAGQMGVEMMLKESIGSLSGGQLQRVLLARAIIDSPKLIILDEPNSYVDKLFENNFYKLLSKINQEIAVMLVSHDVGTILPMVKNIACVNGDLHYHSGSDISSEWLQNAYDCPIEILGHGSLPHRVLPSHEQKHTHSGQENY